jgi:catechol 2,3-dioxygenase-like lactoylglutathione lyase family enzyme
MFESTFHGITGLSHTGFDVEDLDRTIDFYTKVLGAKVEWRRQGSNGPICKLYIGELGLSIPQRKAGAPKLQVPFAIHFAFKVRPEMADACIAHVKSCGIEVDGPNGHPQEGQNLSWFFSDPDGHRLEIEAHYPTVEEAVAVLERDRELRRPDLGLYQGGDALPELKEAQAAKTAQGV